MEDPLSLRPHPPGLKLIETMLWDGAAAPRLALHRARLAASALRLGWAAPDLALPDLPALPLRLRVTLDAAGALDWQTAPLPPGKAQWRVAVHPQRLRSDDPWLGVKSTQRALYDSARAELPDGVDEWIFLNERDEVCEGTITSLFFDRGPGMRTPPLSCGLLPGVLRAELAPPEEVLRAGDLQKARLWCGNALRGLMPAILS